MATYKVKLTVKDRYGSVKHIDGGLIDVGLDGLTEKDFNDIEEILPLENYVTKEEIKDYVPEQKSPVYVPTVTPNNMLVFDLKDTADKEKLVYDIDKTNDWNKLDGTNGSSYMWEPMQ
jgi:hypothetical protein